jgi:hypothetical protein
MAGPPCCYFIPSGSPFQFLKTNNIDSLVFDHKSNTFYDKYGDGSGSVYKFNNSDVLSFYCFLNGKAYPYAMHFNEKGEFVKTEGRPSLRNQYEVNSDSSYTFTFFYSTFLKTDYQVQSIFNTTDTINSLFLPVSHFTNVGGFNIIVRTKKDVIEATIVNHIRFFEDVRKIPFAFVNTINLKDVIFSRPVSPPSGIVRWQ